MSEPVLPASATRLPAWQEKPPVYQASRFAIHALELAQRQGGKLTREVVVPRDAVVILPCLDEQHLVLIRNERFAVGRTLWELPAGTLEAGEDPATCAGRELVEETGYQAASVKPLLGFFPTPGFCTELLHGFVATDLTQVGQDLDETERIEPEVVTWTQALAMVRDHRIIDAKTIATMLYYHVFVRASSHPNSSSQARP